MHHRPAQFARADISARPLRPDRGSRRSPHRRPCAPGTASRATAAMMNISLQLVEPARRQDQLADELRIGLLAFDDAIRLVHVSRLDAAVGREFEAADAQTVVAEIRRQHRGQRCDIVDAMDALQQPHARRHRPAPPQLHIGRDLVEGEARLQRAGDAAAVELAREELEALDMIGAGRRRNMLQRPG